MAKKKSQLNPAAKSLDYQDREPDWLLVSNLLGGTPKMRKEGATYLTQHAEENTDAFEERLDSAVLYNAFEEAVDGVVSRVFAEPVILKEDEASETFKEHASDITGLGENLDGFARRVFQSGVAYGIS
jgi:hypothetical protein